MPRRTSSSVGFGCSPSRATAARICPGVQKPHWSASCSMNARLHAVEFAVARQAFDRRDVRPLARGGEREAGVGGYAVDAGPCTRRTRRARRRASFR